VQAIKVPGKTTSSVEAALARCFFDARRSACRQGWSSQNRRRTDACDPLRSPRIERRLQSLDQFLLCVWLRQSGKSKVDLMRQFGISGRENDRQLGPYLTDPRCEIEAVYARQERWFAWYVSGTVAVGLDASLILPDTRKYGYLEGTGDVERNLA
jgi:hypothetical protein